MWSKGSAIKVRLGSKLICTTDLAEHPLCQGAHEKNSSSTMAWYFAVSKTQNRETVRGHYKKPQQLTRAQYQGTNN
jgi:hypothetical protein